MQCLNCNFDISKLADKHNVYRQPGWLCTRWGEIAQSLNFNYLYKSHCQSSKLLLILYDRVPVKSPQQFVEFAVTLVKIIKV